MDGKRETETESGKREKCGWERRMKSMYEKKQKENKREDQGGMKK